jgi:hypothetical protein
LALSEGGSASEGHGGMVGGNLTPPTLSFGLRRLGRRNRATAWGGGSIIPLVHLPPLPLPGPQ